jgi:glycogen synthase
MELLFVTPSVEETDPSGSTAMGLARLLRGLGHGVTVVSPLLASVDPNARSLARRLTKIEAEVHGAKHPCMLFEGRTQRGVQLLFLGHDEHFRAHATLGTGDTAATQLAANVFADAVRILLEGLDRRFDAAHGFGWLGALAVARLEDNPVLRPARINVGLEASDAAARSMHAGLAVALSRADAITVSSASVVETLLARASTDALRSALAERAGRIRVIGPALDAGVWNPATSPALRAQFDRTKLAARAENRRALEELFSLPPRPGAPLVGVWVRGDAREDLTSFLSVAPEALRNEGAFAVLLDGASAHARTELTALAGRWPDRFRMLAAENKDAVQLLFAGADFFLCLRDGFSDVPSHLAALAYGAIPIAPRAEPYAGALVDMDSALASGTAILYAEDSRDGMLAGLRRAYAACTKPEQLLKRRAAAMATDHSWERAARSYEATYAPPVAAEPATESPTAAL